MADPRRTTQEDLQGLMEVTAFPVDTDHSRKIKAQVIPPAASALLDVGDKCEI